MYDELDSEVLEDESVSLLREQVHEFAKNEMRPASVELDRMDPKEVAAEGSPYFTIFNAMKKMGLHKMFTPTEYEGLGFSAKQIHVVMEELGWGSSGLTAAIAVDMVLPVIAAVFNDATGGSLQEWVDLITKPWMEDDEGKLRGCVPFTEPEHGSDIFLSPHLCADHCKTFGLRTPARLDKVGEDWVVNGAKASWPTSAPVSTHCFTCLNIEPHESVQDQTFAFIPLDLEGVTKGTPIDKMGMRECPQGELAFDNVKLPSDYIIMVPGMWASIGGILLGLLSTGYAVVSVGLARAAFEEALRYTKERVQGGKPLIEHDSVLLKLASMYEKVESARAYSRAVLDFAFGKMFVEKSFEFPTAGCHACKVFCTQQAYDVAHEAVQLHGTYGLTKDALIEKLFRDARMGLICEGCNNIKRLASGYCLSEDYRLE